MRERSRTEYSIINIFTGLFGYGLNTIVGFGCRIIFVRTLSADYLGLSGLFTNILSMFSLAELGISSAITYALYKPIVQNDTEKIKSLMKFYKKAYEIIGIFVAIIGIIVLPFLSIIIREPPDIRENLYVIYLIYLFNSVISYFFSYKSSLLTAMQRNYIVIGYNYIITIGQSFFQIIFLLLTHKYIIYLLIQMLGGVLYNLWISHKASKDYPYIDDREVAPLEKEEKKSLFKNVKALAVYKLSGVLVNNTDNIAITFFNGISTTGYASNYILFSMTLDKLITMIFNALTGSIGNFNASADEEKQYEFFKVLNLSNFWLYGWAAIGMNFISSDLVRLLYGCKYVMGKEIPFILAINMYTIGMLHASYTYKSTMGLFKYGQYILIFTGFLNLFFDIILGRRYGTIGIYFATLIARLLTNLWYEPYAVYKYGLHKKTIFYFFRSGVFAVVLAVTGVLCGFLCNLCHFNLIMDILLKILICSVIHNLVLWICFGRTKEFQYLFDVGIRLIRRVLGKNENLKLEE